MIKPDFTKIKAFLVEKKKLLIPAGIVAVIVIFIALKSGSSNDIQTDTVRYEDLSQVVRATGQVISDTDLDLSFNSASTVSSVRVKVGDKVGKGQVLATLNQGQVLASLTQARAALLGAQAKYDKILQGASNEEITLAEVALQNAKTDLENIKNNQTTLVANARQAMLNSSIAPSPSSSTSPTITGTYTGTTEGVIRIAKYQTSGGGYFSISGLVTGSGLASATTPQPIGNSGLYIQFSSTPATEQEWNIEIPNTQASDYLTNYNAYLSATRTQTSAVSSAQSLVDQRQAELNVKKASARGVDLDIAQADVLSAEGNLQSAQSKYEDTVIRAPAAGTITRVDIKYGELSQAGKAVITLEDVDNLYVEALINESNIVSLKIGQPVDITFDAFGAEKTFTGTVAEIDPSAETNDGVVNYKIKVAMDTKDVTVRPGMNANITVVAGTKDHVLAIPYSAVTKKDNTTTVSVVTNLKKNTAEDRNISIGFIGDNNLVEILSGLTEGETIILSK